MEHIAEKAFFGVIIAIAAVALLSYATIKLYFLIRSKRASSKWGVEIGTVAVVLFISIAFKFAVCWCVWGRADHGLGEYPFWRSMTAAMEAMYTGVAGLTFGDLMETGGVFTWLRVAYFGTSVYAGLMILGIVTAKASYETYSFLRMKRLEHYKDVFVFTALNERSMMLAKSIKEREEEVAETIKAGDKKNPFVLLRNVWIAHKKKHPVIVFAGEELPPFDRHNELCMEVMENDFLYWSYNPQRSNKQDGGIKKKSIAKALHLNNHNRDPKHETLRFAVFAFAEENGTPHEEENFDDVITDVEARIQDIRSSAMRWTRRHARKNDAEKKCKKAVVRDDGLNIEYYILTKRETNYQAYQYRKDELTANYLEIVESLSAAAKEITLTKEPMFTIDVWNAADMVATQVAEYVNRFDRPERGDKKEVRAWIIGFGNTGKAVSKALYQHTAWFDENGHANAFLADVFDKKGDECYGLFRQENPLAICVDAEKIADKVWAPFKEKALALYANDDRAYEAARLAVWESATREEWDALRNARVRQAERNYMTPACNQGMDLPSFAWEKELSYPCYRFNGKPVLGWAFSEWAALALEDEAWRKEQAKGRVLQECTVYSNARHVPDYFVVTTGEDYLNVKVTNALVSQLMRRADHKKIDVTVFVKIADPKNNVLICPMADFSKKDVDRNEESNGMKIIKIENVRVVIVGNDDDVFNYRHVLAQREYGEYQVSYNRVYDRVNDEESGVFTVGEKEELSRMLAAYLTGSDPGIPEELRKYLATFNNLTKETTETAELLSKSVEAVEAVGGSVDPGTTDAIKRVKGGVEWYDHSVRKWQETKFWNRVSSREAALFAPTFYLRYEKAKKEKDFDECAFFCEMLRLEHERWMRLHIVNGWSYCPSDEEKSRRRHHCLVPVGGVPVDKLAFDLINVCWSIAKGEIDQKKGTGGKK